MTAFRILALIAAVAALAAVVAHGTPWSAAAAHDVSSGARAGLTSLFGIGGSEDEADEDDPGDGAARRPAAAPPPALPVATAVISAAVGALAGGFVALRVRRVWVRLRERFTVR
jgi:hypothetical protein